MKNKNSKYAFIKGCAFAAKNGVVNDSIGRVIYALKANPKVQLENLTDTDNKALITPNNTVIGQISHGQSNSYDCFYKVISSQSQYSQTVTVGTSVTSRTLTQPTINVYKIQLTDTIWTLDIRSNDPWVLKHVDVAPFELFTSIAITNAEIQSIISATTSLDSSPKTFSLGVPQLISGDVTTRVYYKSQLSIVGSQNGTTKKTRITIATNVYVYSLDNCNWVSADYASAAFNIIPGYVWDNDVIPNPIGANPFSAYWSQLQSNLQSIISQANNLPAANDNKGNRLLNQPIRDYLYQGNIDKLTFEMAFRLPFFLENSLSTPYANYQTAAGTSRPNNPYFTAFDDWFGYANWLRTAAGLASLTESGKLSTEYNSGYNDYNQVYYTLLTIAPKYLNNYVSQQVGAYMAKNFDFENEAFKTTPDVPAPSRSAPQGAARNLSDLVNSGAISAAAQAGLQNGSIKYAKITDGTYASELIKDGYVSKNTKTGDFFVYICTWNEQPKQPNNSGLTFGFGYDIGQNDSLSAFQDYTGITVPDSGTLHDAVTDALGKKKIPALDNYYLYYDSVWKTPQAQMTFQQGVLKTVPLMKSAQYMQNAVIYAGKKYIVQGQKSSNLYLRIFQPSFGFFFNEGRIHQFLNEMEKVFLLSLAWNKGAGSLNPFNTKKPSYQPIAKRAIHSFNTHDIRYAQHAMLLSEITHHATLANMLNSVAMNNYFQNIQS